MRVWYRLRNWVQNESESAQIYLRLSEAATKYTHDKNFFKTIVIYLMIKKN